MSDPDTAALDPIFWLHHANIDRLRLWAEQFDRPAPARWRPRLPVTAMRIARASLSG